MTVLSGLTPGVQWVPGPAQQASAGQPMAPSTTLPAVIDGTPVRVVVLALSAAAGLMALHAAGFRFNVGVSA